VIFVRLRNRQTYVGEQFTLPVPWENSLPWGGLKGPQFWDIHSAHCLHTYCLLVS
jgi:hypothetical protein